MEVRTRYREEMERVNRGVAQMGAVLLSMLQQIYQAAVGRATADLDRLHHDDQQVNQLEAELVQQTVRLVNVQQPVASDLRRLIGVLRIVSDLERIGDHVVHIARILPAEVQHRQRIALLPAMIDWAINMLDQALTAFSFHDPALAAKIIADDLTLDEMHKNVLRTIMTDAREHNDHVAFAIPLLFLTRFLERIGDHVASICKWCLYVTAGYLPPRKDH